MKSIKPITALIALLGASSAMAANLKIPMSFEYLALDGKKVEGSLFNHKSDLELSEGTHKIAIRYHDMVQDDFSDSESFVKSSPFIVTLAVDGDYEYQLQPAEGEIIKKPKSFAKSPAVVISRVDGGNVNYKVTQTDITESSFVSKLFNGDSGQDIEAATAAATGGAAVARSTAPAQQANTVEAVTLPAKLPANPSDADHAQQMLQYWWLHADEKTRKEFMSWAIQQL
ncbi:MULTISPECIES: DUF2057 domain-containing protein [Shewanella]|uniref:DUF2057 domain-containing protein n=1 Tax=Shewanella marisflavi TaxID=260364 RepID=A0ABX5WKL5_9GAMM|nr:MULTISPECIES: DUF2057 domain-containing protein [Shewanella]MCL1042182.1 DUF2057 domain-containing protein [Shewanella marisflavi]QDF74857.1 DUF2057 domain-containing protein [Shewanella marisflavi]